MLPIVLPGVRLPVKRFPETLDIAMRYFFQDNVSKVEARRSYMELSCSKKGIDLMLIWHMLNEILQHSLFQNLRSIHSGLWIFECCQIKYQHFSTLPVFGTRHFDIPWGGLPAERIWRWRQVNQANDQRPDFHVPSEGLGFCLVFLRSSNLSLCLWLQLWLGQVDWSGRLPWLGTALRLPQLAGVSGAKQDAAHEPKCSHVCQWHRCQNTWICSHAQYLSAIVYLNSLVHVSLVTSLRCGVESVECGVWSVK